MRILVTNDDGIDSVGLHVLARRLTDLGDVVIVAPDAEYSGFGAALGTLHTMRPEAHRRSVEGVPESWAVTGPPALCVYFARLGCFGDVDLVVSGINPGANTGRAIYHSGTVGAALTARNGRIPGIAVSQAAAYGVEGQAWDDMLADMHWDTAAEAGAVVAQRILASDEDDAPVVNVNVPNLPLDQLLGWRFAEVAELPPRTVGKVELTPKQGHEGAFHVAMEWGDVNEMPADTDSGAVERGEVAVTVLSRIQHQDRPSLGLAAAMDDLLAR